MRKSEKKIKNFVVETYVGNVEEMALFDIGFSFIPISESVIEI